MELSLGGDFHDVAIWISTASFYHYAPYIIDSEKNTMKSDFCAHGNIQQSTSMKAGRIKRRKNCMDQYPDDFHCMNETKASVILGMK